MRRLFIGWLLNAAYLLAIVVAAPWLVWSMFSRGKYREGYAQKLFGYVPRRDGGGPCIWLHAVSVGEVNVLGTLVARIEDRWPGAKLYISSTTKTGFDLACKKYARHSVFYCPLDFTWAVRRAMRRIRPDLLVLAELELWPNLIRAARRHGAAVAIINGRLSDASFRGYGRIRPLVAGVLRQIDVIAAQDETTAARFRALSALSAKGVRNLFSPEKRFLTPFVSVTGSMKFDGAETDRRNPATERLRQLAAIAQDDVVFLAGSTQAPEEELAIDTYRALVREFPSLRLILVPRHPQRFDEVASILSASGLPFIRRSQLDAKGSGEQGVAGVEPRGEPPVPHLTIRDESQIATSDRFPSQQAQVADSPGGSASLRPQPPDSRPLLLVDTIGELSAWWGLSDIAFVGGSLFSTRGGQNMIEPAAYGAAVCFGPNTRNFRDIVHALCEAKAACIVADGDELTAFVRHCLTDGTWATELGNRAQALVRSQLGATDRTLALLTSLLSERSKDLGTRAWQSKERHPRPAA